MNRTIALLTLCGLMMMSAFAVSQDAPKGEIFGGYQYFHLNSGVSGVSGFNLNGWNASASGYVNRYFGFTGDFSGSYGTPTVSGVGINTKIYTYMFGPVVRAGGNHPLQPFAHVLFGGAHVSGSVSGVGSASDSGFAWAAGGGLDYKVAPRFAIRVGQFDFLQTHIASNSQNNFRYSAGVVLRF